jgi:hypothetical protein
MPHILSNYFSFIIFPKFCNLPSSIKKTKYITHMQKNYKMTSRHSCVHNVKYYCENITIHIAKLHCLSNYIRYNIRCSLEIMLLDMSNLTLWYSRFLCVWIKSNNDSCFQNLVAGLHLSSLRFDIRLVHVGSVADKVTLRMIFPKYYVISIHYIYWSLLFHSHLSLLLIIFCNQKLSKKKLTLLSKLTLICRYLKYRADLIFGFFESLKNEIIFEWRFKYFS